MNKKSKRNSLERRMGKYGFYFTLPWIIGFLLFFAIPLFKSVLFAFSKVTISPDGFLAEFVGLGNFKEVFGVDPDYISNYSKALSSFLYRVPIIIMLSFTLAIVLNQKFHGRLLARAIFFMPTIIASGVVMAAFSIDVSATSEIAASGSGAYFGKAIDFTEMLSDMGLPPAISETVEKYIADISSLIWNCGVQIILLLSGLQAIPPQLYEVSKVEGANGWEEFWFITFPMMTNILIVTLAYTIIDVMTEKSNFVMQQAYRLISGSQIYDKSAAMIWGYFPVIGLIVAAAFLLIDRTMVRRWN